MIVRWTFLALLLQTVCNAAIIETFPIPPDFILSGFGSSEVYRGQTFRLPSEDASLADNLTVFVGPTTDIGANFRVLVTEVDMTGGFHPTNVLFESGTLNVSRKLDSFVIDLDGLVLQPERDYAWILDHFVVGNQATHVSIGTGLGSYTEGMGFSFPNGPFFPGGTRQDHFESDNWFIRANDFAFQLKVIAVPEPTTLALVDIKPGSVPNSVNLNSKGVLPVAILSTDEFDVNEVDFDTLLFGDPLLIDNGGTAVSPLRSALEDVSGDGLLDLTLKFSTADLVEHGVLGSETVEGLLSGELLDGTPFAGTDSIRIVPPNRSKGNSLQVSTVPEPTTSALALAALCLAMSRRRST